MTLDVSDALLAIDVDVVVTGSHRQSAVGRPSDAPHVIGGISQGRLELEVLAGGSHRGPPGTVGKNTWLEMRKTSQMSLNFSTELVMDRRMYKNTKNNI